MKTYPLLQSQMGVFLDWMSNPTLTRYNLPCVVPFPKTIDKGRILKMLQTILDGRRVLHTGFVLDDDGQPRQYSNPDKEIKVVCKEMTDEQFDEYASNGFVRPFDLLSGEPLCRMELIDCPSSTNVLFDVHHIIADGVTLAPLMTIRDVTDAYFSQLKPDLEYGLYEYAEDEQKILQSEAYAEAKQYYADKFKGRNFTPLCTLPSDCLGNSIREDAYIPAAEVDKWCTENGTQSNLLFMAAFSYVLSVMSREDDVVYSTINHGRMDRKLRQAYGMFVKSVPVLAKVDRNASVIDFIKGFRVELMSTIRHGAYPFSHLCRDLQMQPAVEFGFQGTAMQEFCEIDGEHITCRQLDRGQTTSNLTCIIYLSEGKYDIRLTASDAIFSRSALRTIARAILNVTGNMMAAPLETLAALSVMDSRDEAELARLRSTAVEEIPWKLYYQPIEENAVKYADRTALIAKDRTLSFAEFNAEVNRVAHALLRKGVKRGDRVVLLLPRRSGVIISMFGVSKTGAAYIPCDPEYPSERIKLIMTDSEAQYIITTPEHAGDYPTEKIILIDDIYNNGKALPGDELNPCINVNPEDLAYLIYTSGSTGRPKGVMLRHVGIANYLYPHPANVHIQGLVDLSVKSFVSITTLSFDMSLKEFAGSLFNGITSILADEQEVLDAQLLADLMKRTGAEGINGTCSRLVSYMELPAFCEALSHCKTVWSGGEQYPQQLMAHLQALGVHIFNTYGPTEITVSSNIADLTHAEKVSVGRPLLNYVEFVVDPYGNELPVGFVGELLIGGPGVARGYNNLPEMTAERFVEYKGVRVYRSGDLARRLPDGQVEILGRIDSQIKLRGFRIELGEVENLAATFEGISQAVADVRHIGATEHLSLYYVSEAEIDEDALAEFLSQHLTEYMVPTAFMRIDNIPLTPNGKTNRKALPVPKLKITDIVAPRNEMEQKVLDIVSEILQIDGFGVTNDLLALGLSSLAAMRLAAAFKKRLGTVILMRDIMKNPTVEAITAVMQEQPADSYELKTREKRETYPLSGSQKGMVVDCLINKDALQYNIPILIHFRNVDADRLADSLVRIADAHPYMKVRLRMSGEDVVQVRDDSLPVTVNREVLTSMPDRAFFQSRIKPFDILNEPLYRFNVFSYGDHVFALLDIHHLIGDGSSNFVIAGELERAYNGEILTPETYTAYDRALDEEELMKSERGREAETYFDNLLAGTDVTVYPHSDRIEGDRKQDVEDIDIKSLEIEAFCKRHSLPVSSYFLTVFHQVLHRIVRDDNTLVCFISNGRSEMLLNNFFGVLVKTLPSVCGTFTGDMESLVRKVNDQMQDTIRNDFYPFADMVERYGLKAEIMYNYFVDLQTTVSLGGKECEEVYGLDWDMAKNPLSITMLRADDGINYTARIEYDATLYNRKDMHTLASVFKVFAESACQAIYGDLKKVPLMSAEECGEVLKLSRGKEVPYDVTKTFPGIFIKVAGQNPDSPAVVDEMGTYTYGELNRLSGALALKLRELGVGDAGSGSPFVSIMLGYCKDFLVAAIGVERAGGAYVPLDYDYPTDRLLYMLEDSESRVLITSHEILEEKKAEGDGFTTGNILFIEDFIAGAGDAGCSDIDFSTPDGLAYMIYTSGSTGKPKGVMIPHRAKSHFVQFIAREWGHSARSRICCHSSFSFDASIEDLYPVLTVGGTLYTVPQEARKDMVILHDFIVDNGITGGCYTTQFGQMLLQMYPDLAVDYLVVGGEKMTVAPECKCRLINTYGPTEFTVDATFFDAEPGKEYKNIPIGRPLHNLSAYVVDNYGHLVPQGVTGELCMGGIQMAAGYWKREDLTAEKFSDCAFAGGKIYHTGDLVRYNTDGQIEYLGRIDSQVKLRGFRIELGEIETLIAGYEGVRMVSVQVKEVGGVQHLCAYYSADTEIDSEELKAYLAGQLTDYMVPTAYMQLDKMPLTPNGKVNSKALPQPEIKAEAVVAPETETEKKLFGIAVELLKHEQFGVTSNLISMGLTSLSAIRLAVLLQQQFEVTIPITSLLATPTIREIADGLDKGLFKSTKTDAMFTKRETHVNEGIGSAPKANPFTPKKNPFAAKKNPFEK